MSELISIVVPVYNVGPYLSDFFSHMQEQTFQNYRAYVVYDESSDNSYEEITKIVKMDPEHFQIIMSPKKDGLGAARDCALNSGMLHGKYIMFLDPDDYPDNCFLEELYNTAEETKADITICGFERFDDKSGKTICIEMVHNPEKIIDDIHNCDLLAYMNPVVWNKLYRMDLIGETRFTNIKRTEDVFWLMRLIPKIKTVKCINKVLYHYRVREDSLLNTISEKDYDAVLNEFGRISSEMRNNGIYDSEFWPVIEFVAFCRFGIGVTYRVCNKKNCFRIAEKTRNLLDQSYSKWRKNRFLKLKYCCKHGIKGIAIWACGWLHKSHLFCIYVFLYTLMKIVMKKEIRW